MNSRAVGGCEVAALSETLDSSKVRWTLEALPSTTIVTAFAAHLRDRRFGISYPALKTLAAPGEHLLTAKGTQHRVLANDDVGDQTAVLLPLDRFFEIRVKSALRLWRSLSNLSPGPDPGALSTQRRSRFLLALRGVDGQQAGCSYREISDALFGRQKLSAISWKTHHLRDRVIRTVKLGTELMQGGYRQLLLHPYRKRIPKSLGWGGDLATH
jgi:hypothetical protein